jgi:hypothetical protein
VRFVTFMRKLRLCDEGSNRRRTAPPCDLTPRVCDMEVERDSASLCGATVGLHPHWWAGGRVEADQEVSRRPGGPPHKCEARGHSVENQRMPASGTAR